MPSLDSISEWVLANLYLVGAVTGAVLLLILLILLLVGRRGRSFDEQAGGPESWQEDGRLPDDAESDVFGETLAPAPIDAESGVFGETLAPAQMMEPTAPFTHAELFTDAADDSPPTAARVEDAAEDAADDAHPSPAPSPAPPPETPLSAYVPPAKPLWDHARDIVQGLIQGQGDITMAELRRLDLVRPEKVLEVTDELAASLQGRGNESQRARLAKIRQHVETLMPPVVDLEVVETESGTAEPDRGTFEGGALKEDYGIFESTAFEAEGAALEPGSTLTTSEAWDDAVEQSGTLSDSLDPQPEIAPLFTSAPSPVIGEAVAIEPAPETAGPADEPLGEPAAEAAAADAAAEGPAEEAAAAEGPAEEAAAERPTEEGFLGLDQSERVASLSSLTPKELGRVFSATDDKAAKLSIIDTLETMSGVETMSVIQLILDDPDPEVQLRALDAAERLLAQE